MDGLFDRDGFISHIETGDFFAAGFSCRESVTLRCINTLFIKEVFRPALGEFNGLCDGTAGSG